VPGDAPAIPVKLVKAYLRDAEVHLWRPPYSDPATGASCVPDALLEQVVAATHITAANAATAVEHLRAVAFNHKLRQLRNLPGAAPVASSGTAQAESDSPWASESHAAPSTVVADPFASSSDPASTAAVVTDPFAADSPSAVAHGSDPFAAAGDPSPTATDAVAVSSAEAAPSATDGHDASDPFSPTFLQSSTADGSSGAATDPFASTAEGSATTAGPATNIFGDPVDATAATVVDGKPADPTDVFGSSSSTPAADPFGASTEGAASSGGFAANFG
jgi:hypothetical protein